MKKKHKIPTQNALIASLTTRDTTTANGAVSHSTTGTALLDFFGKGGALRVKPSSEAITLFSRAYAENKDLALKILFYLGDVREGQGERKLFRTLINWLSSHDNATAKKLLKYVPEFTRWDNVLEGLVGTPLEAEALKLVSKQLEADLKSETPSICAKWAPSEQASSGLTKSLAKKLREYMELTPRQYRKMLSALRAKIDVVERKMCSGEWTSINYPGVPSKASTLYRKAFSKHDPTGYVNFLKKVEKGESKINASVLYPYDLVTQYINSYNPAIDRTVEAQWKALPNYLQDNPHNGIVVADVSGSMDSGGSGSATPIAVAVSLAIYFAERNVGAFKDHFMIFSNDTKLLRINGASLKDNVASVLGSREVANTNLQSVFDLILGKAVANKIPESELPSTIYLVSDMQFDTACSVGWGSRCTNLDAIKNKYERAGYKMPSIVFWNVNSRSDVPIKVNDEGVCLVSGCSPVILKSVFGGKVSTPWEVMINTVQTKRYQYIVAAK